jgi:hypothetical protein
MISTLGSSQNWGGKKNYGIDKGMQMVD